VDSDGLRMRNFEWERRMSNFNPNEFGQEMDRLPQGIYPVTTESMTGDSLPSMSDFDKAVEEGVVDFKRASKERIDRVRLSKAI